MKINLSLDIQDALAIQNILDSRITESFDSDKKSTVRISPQTIKAHSLADVFKTAVELALSKKP